MTGRGDKKSKSSGMSDHGKLEANRSEKNADDKKMDETNADDADAAKLDAAAEARIGSRLKAMYDEVVSEPVPDHLLELLQQLDDKKD